MERNNAWRHPSFLEKWAMLMVQIMWMKLLCKCEEKSCRIVCCIQIQKANHIWDTGGGKTKG